MNGILNIDYDLHETTDGGRNWRRIGDKLPGIGNWPYMEYNKAGDLLIAGGSGVGILENENYNPGEKFENPHPQKPVDYTLYQNYPNPFNPTTSIKYEIQNGGLVQLKVYDILGREVVTLVNAYQPSGNHTVEFNGHNLSSGIYFYQLKSGSFSSTRKFILMK